MRDVLKCGYNLKKVPPITATGKRVLSVLVHFLPVAMVFGYILVVLADWTNNLFEPTPWRNVLVTTIAVLAILAIVFNFVAVVWMIILSQNPNIVPKKDQELWLYVVFLGNFVGCLVFYWWFLHGMRTKLEAELKNGTTDDSEVPHG